MRSPSQSFSARQLGWMRRWRSQAHLRTASGERPTNDPEWRQLLADTSKKIASDAFSFDGIKWRKVKGKWSVTTPVLEETLVVRKLSDNVRRSYVLRQQNREALVRTALQALRENVNKTIIRIDLKECFESIDRRQLINQLRLDSKLSSQSLVLLTKFFDRAAKRCPVDMTRGIPRGTPLSTSLAEIKLRLLDRDLRNIAGTYLVLRFVDDILVFTTQDEASAISSASTVVANHGFKLNHKKTATLRVACKCETSCCHGASCPCKNGKKCACYSEIALHGIEYLGYKILIPEGNNPKGANRVFCVLSGKKTSKLKSRIVKAIEDCRITGNWALLERRMIFLTSNQLVTVTPGRGGLYSGLAYRYPAYKEPPNGTREGTLGGLDNFYRARLRALLKFMGPPPVNKSKLQAITFKSGFDHKRRCKFTALQVIEIKKCWAENA